MKGMGGGILVVAISAIFAAVAVTILNNISTTGWASIDVTVFTYIGTFILLGVLAYAAFAYRYK